jgi:dihydrofolate reductase
MSKQKYKKVIREIPIVDHKAILVTIHQEVEVEAIVVVIEEAIVEVETINDVVVVGSIKIIHQHLPEEMIITKLHNNNNNN